MYSTCTSCQERNKEVLGKCVKMFIHVHVHVYIIIIII